MEKGEVIELESIKEAMIYILANFEVTKYRLAKQCNLSTSTHVTNYITGRTTKARPEVMKLIFLKYNIVVSSFKDTKEYRKLTQENKQPKGIKI